MNKMKKLLALALCLAMVLALAACGGAGTDIVGTSSTPAPTEAAEGGVLTVDEAIYMAALGDFYEVYQEALAAESLSERWALMAVAEAKFLESGVASPMYTAGGCYAMSRTAFRSGGYISWKGDRVYYDQMILTNEVIGNEDYAALTDLWYELAGTGTYSDSAREYLAGKDYTFADTAVTTFDRVGTTWDILSDGDFHDDASFIDYLYQYDSESVQQPRLATGYTVSDDGLTYTFDIREGVEWVDSQGRKVADLVADDWVAGLQHLADTGSSAIDNLRGVVVGVAEYLSGEITDFSQVGIKAVNVPGCPPNPLNLVGTIAAVLAGMKLELDSLNRPKLFFGHTVHELCERLPHFEAGEFAPSFDSEEARKGWCLYKLGCKGPVTYNNCPKALFNDVNWPVAAGHPCIGCSEPNFWDKMTPFFEN